MGGLRELAAGKTYQTDAVCFGGETVTSGGPAEGHRHQRGAAWGTMLLAPTYIRTNERGAVDVGAEATMLHVK